MNRRPPARATHSRSNAPRRNGDEISTTCATAAARESDESERGASLRRRTSFVRNDRGQNQTRLGSPRLEHPTRQPSDGRVGMSSSTAYAVRSAPSTCVGVRQRPAHPDRLPLLRPRRSSLVAFGIPNVVVRNRPALARKWPHPEWMSRPAQASRRAGATRSPSSMKTLRPSIFAMVAYVKGLHTSTAEREIRSRLVERVRRCLVTAKWLGPFGLTSVMSDYLQ